MASITLKHIFKIYPHSKKEKKKEMEKNLSPFAVKDFNLEIKDGEFVVLVGPSGCGKSTTLRMIAGLEDISGGELYIGKDLANNIDASKRNIAMVFQNYALYPHMTSYQNMSYGLKLRKIPKPVVDKDGKPVLGKDGKQKIKLVHYTKAEIDEKVQKAAEILDIKHLLDRKPSEMSGGQRQRVALGRALVRSPRVFLLDEPLSNLDAKLRASMRNEIVKLHEKVKTTFVYVTHDQVEAMTMGDRIVVMKDGVIQQVGKPSEIYDNPQNLFVAGFIGTPQMNFFEADFRVNGKDVEITLPNKVEMLDKVSKFKPIKKEYSTKENKRLILGIRAEHIAIADKGIPAIVNFVEVLGNIVNVICKLEKCDAEFSITVQNRVNLHAKDKIFINFDAKNIHLFDKESESTIYNLVKEE